MGLEGTYERGEGVRERQSVRKRAGGREIVTYEREGAMGITVWQEKTIYRGMEHVIISETNRAR